ncbi:MAG TPA: serine hydrolase domain-containing protein [Bryobacteraceae bacterium]|jgi:CubicO group peptidase (beta-lactamase class C family)|nr:serine hydrolase domain-containing protein [Bryobacteraceae bacterium]
MLRVIVLLAAALSSLHDFFPAELAHYGVVGGSVLVISGGQVSEREYYGEANRESQQAVDAETTFHWASITKTFTGIAILQLRDRGLLKLDDPVVKYVAELRAVHDPYGPIDAITIRELMTHSAGFRAATWPWGGDHDWEPFEPTEWSQIVAMLPYTEILFPPGTKHSYSNLGVVFLGQIIERLSGDPYQVYIDKNILKPLQMYASYFDRAPYFLLRHRAEGYYREKGVLRRAPFNFSSGITVSNSGLNAPLSDMAKYLEFLLGGGDRRNSSDVLKRSSLEEMFQKQLAIDASGASQTAGERGRDWIGLSFFIHEQGGRKYIGHGGEQGGFISHFYVDPAHGNAYIVAFNTDSSDAATNTHKLDAELRDYIFAHVFGVR